MKVVELHRLPVSFVHVPVQPHDAVEVVLLFRTQVTHGDVLVRVVAHEVAVTLHLRVAAFHHVHALLVGHGERGDVHHVPEFQYNASSTFSSTHFCGVAESDCGKLLA